MKGPEYSGLVLEVVTMSRMGVCDSTAYNKGQTENCCICLLIHL